MLLDAFLTGRIGLILFKMNYPHKYMFTLHFQYVWRISWRRGHLQIPLGVVFSPVLVYTFLTHISVYILAPISC